MSPGGRRGRTHGSAEEGHLRDLSPDTTLRAFTQKPMPFDTSRDEYKIFGCIESLTAAERDLGARVAKAAQRLKSWCAEIEQWGWSGDFEPPNEAYREKRRRSLELRIREHVGDADLSDALPALEYWGSLLSVEVESHEARLDDMEEEMLKLDVEELKEHVLDMHPVGRSRPSSAGIGANGRNYQPMDDFSFLITQTLLSALPHHAQLKERLSTWTARISVLREVPRFLADSTTAQKAMRLGWEAIEPPADTSDTAFTQWKEAVDTISGVLGSKVSDLGQRLDMMLDTLEGREDCIPDGWIDAFEAIETDHGRWTHESRRRVIDFDVRRKGEKRGSRLAAAVTDNVDIHSIGTATRQEAIAESATVPTTTVVADRSIASRPAIAVAAKGPALASYDAGDGSEIPSPRNAAQAAEETTLGSNSTPHKPAITPKTNTPYSAGPLSSASSQSKRLWFRTDDGLRSFNGGNVDASPANTSPISASSPGTMPDIRDRTVAADILVQKNLDDLEVVDPDDESDFDEGDTVVHHDLDDSSQATVNIQSVLEESYDVPTGLDPKTDDVLRFRHRPANLSDAPTIITNDGEGGGLQDPPQTPRSRRDSIDSISSNTSVGSSPAFAVEDSPSVRNASKRGVRAPRPELNASMAKRRTGRGANDNEASSAPWPPSQFSQKPANSADDLERKISDILTTIPAHIRLTSGPGIDAPEVKPRRGLVAKGSRTYLRTARSATNLKAPELTLSPAKSDFDANAASGRKSAAAARTDNDIKLYHLTQPGKEQPIKLFIRRVGENGERVMVRVGGGWSDLGEYLRQYAEHHGRRTASDGKFEILGLEVNNKDTVTSPSRPESVTSKRDRRISVGHPASPIPTPTRTAAPGVPNDDDDIPPPMPSFSGTPGTVEDTSTPSTNSSRRSWTGHEVGLAGPKARKLDLSGEKLDWIEGMMKQARTVSGNIIPTTHAPLQREERTDSRSESRTGGKKPEFGDLGKINGTKRIFLRGGKPSLE
jgi:hypothetical protein